jgi:hypothetical protein
MNGHYLISDDLSIILTRRHFYMGAFARPSSFTACLGLRTVFQQRRREAAGFVSAPLTVRLFRRCEYSAF